MIVSDNQKDAHFLEKELNLKECVLSSVRKVNGGKLVISNLPDYPPIDCTQENCDNLADYIVVMLISNGERLDCFQCTECLDRLLTLGSSNIPIEITH